uniref:cytochrome oxidase subunit III n=1 Tax=Microzonia abyssicola TaxID=217214 RepID=UPI002E785942|nr:cytochrome oxidase subunit III [Syringoderma abyssicola]WBP70376.1 cytochrome oxidase subunit III [Syringoderma abyssicola]
MKSQIKMSHRHPFHLVDPSPWPLVAAVGALSLTFGGVMFMHNFSGGGQLLSLGVVTILFVMGTWWRDIIREASFEGQHTSAVQEGLRMGMILFIVSEVMFFFAFFWAFFTSSLSPVFNIGGVWPPVGIEVISPWGLPLLNTVLLLSSGASVTWAHHAIVGGSKSEAEDALYLTLVFAVNFTSFQALEYFEAPFAISDGVYGSTFYMATGFHGFHVIIGTIFLSICAVRLYYQHFSRQHHFGFEAAAWYWHFVDVVWLILFLGIYWWGA